MKKLLICLLAAVMLLAPAGALAAKLVQPGDDFYYLDEADVLSRDTEGEIFFCNQLLQEACGAQIVVAALNDIGGADIFDYATDMAEEWGIGDAKENNGFLLLMTIEDENYYATTGSGIRGAFSASTLKSLFDKYLEPDFAARNYDAGARKFFEAVRPASAARAAVEREAAGRPIPITTTITDMTATATPVTTKSAGRVCSRSS